MARSARGAAHEDARFSPVDPAEMSEITVEISILEKPRVVDTPNDVVPGVHGVIVSVGDRQGVLLPQAAAESGWGRDALLGHACRKAGLAVDAWKKGATIQVFEAQVYETAPGPTATNGGT